MTWMAPLGHIDEVAGLQDDLLAVAGVALRRDAADLARHDVPADVVVGVIMRRVRPRARDQHGAAHHGVGDVDGLVVDAEADAQRRLVGRVDADLFCRTTVTVCLSKGTMRLYSCYGSSFGTGAMRQQIMTGEFRQVATNMTHLYGTGY